VDTSVWLDLAKDHSQGPLLSALEELVRLEKVSLIVPALVIEEFRRNRERVAKESGQSLKGVLRRVKEAVEEFGDPESKNLVIQHLEDVNQRMPFKGGGAKQSLDRIERLLATSRIIPTSDELRVRAAHRALENKAPFHRNCNSMADAILVETYAIESRTKTRGVRYAFVTHNTKDFSSPQADARVPHPHLAPLFSKLRSLYFIKLTELLNRVDPTLVSEAFFEYSYEQEPRGLSEILEALNRLFDQVWYNRHQVLAEQVRSGEIAIVEREDWDGKYNPHTMVSDIWKGAQQAAKSVQRQYSKTELGPWDDFEWGMINGKLSALRWVLGDDWDFLDT
jgi:hypothetical protein